MDLGFHKGVTLVFLLHLSWAEDALPPSLPPALSSHLAGSQLETSSLLGVEDSVNPPSLADVEEAVRAVLEKVAEGPGEDAIREVFEQVVEEIAPLNTSQESEDEQSLVADISVPPWESLSGLPVEEANQEPDVESEMTVESSEQEESNQEPAESIQGPVQEPKESDEESNESDEVSVPSHGEESLQEVSELGEATVGGEAEAEVTSEEETASEVQTETVGEVEGDVFSEVETTAEAETETETKTEVETEAPSEVQTEAANEPDVTIETETHEASEEESEATNDTEVEAVNETETLPDYEANPQADSEEDLDELEIDQEIEFMIPTPEEVTNETVAESLEEETGGEMEPEGTADEAVEGEVQDQETTGEGHIEGELEEEETVEEIEYGVEVPETEVIVGDTAESAPEPGQERGEQGEEGDEAVIAETGGTGEEAEVAEEEQEEAGAQPGQEVTGEEEVGEVEVTPDTGDPEPPGIAMETPGPMAAPDSNEMDGEIEEDAHALNEDVASRGSVLELQPEESAPSLGNIMEETPPDATLEQVDPGTLVESADAADSGSLGQEAWKIGAIAAAFFLVLQTAVTVVYILKCKRNPRSAHAPQRVCEEGAGGPENGANTAIIPADDQTTIDDLTELSQIQQEEVAMDTQLDSTEELSNSENPRQELRTSVL